MKKEKRVYWLDIQNNNYDDDILFGERKEDLNSFISLAEEEGNVASIDHFIEVILNNNEINVNNCRFKLLEITI